MWSGPPPAARRPPPHLHQANLWRMIVQTVPARTEVDCRTTGLPGRA